MHIQSMVFRIKALTQLLRDGLEGDLPDIATKQIEVRKMVPRFKEGDYDGGILEGVREVVNILGTVEYGDSLRTDLYGSEETGQTDNGASEPLDISNFLMWQASYSELYFSHILWPDYSTKDFHEAIQYYLGRERRFGKVFSKNEEFFILPRHLILN